MQKKVNITINSIFWLGYILLIFSEMFNGISFISNYSNLLTGLGIFILAIFILIATKKYSINFIIWYFFILISSIIVYHRTNDFTIIKLLLLLFCMKSITFDEFIEKEFRIRLIFFIMVVLCFLLGFSKISNFIRGDIIRYTLGFNHPNTAAFYLFLLGCEYIYLTRKQKNKKYVFISLLICIIIKFVTDSRTALVSMILALIGTMCCKNNKKNFWNKSAIKFLIKNMFLILTVGTVLAINLYAQNVSFAIFINKIFSNRLFYFNFFWQTYSVKLFGNTLTTYYFLDSTYLQLLLSFGIIMYFFYYLMYYKSFVMLLKEKKYILIIIFLIMLFYGLTENNIYKPTYNIFLLSFSDTIFRKKTKGSVNVE